MLLQLLYRLLSTAELAGCGLLKMTCLTSVLQVKANGLVVFVPKYGIEGPVYLTSKAKEQQRQNVGASASGQKGVAGSEEAADEYMLDEEKQTVVSKDGNRRFTVFDKAAVQISVVEGTGRRRQLLLQLVERSLLPASEQAQV
jgi:exosome complex exonuclease DIS3/RRP44